MSFRARGRQIIPLLLLWLPLAASAQSSVSFKGSGPEDSPLAGPDWSHPETFPPEYVKAVFKIEVEHDADRNSVGTGFFVDDKGTAITALHVVEDLRHRPAAPVTVVLNDGSKLHAFTVGKCDGERGVDLCVIRLEGVHPEKWFEVVDGEPMPNENLWALGNPGGVLKSVQGAYLGKKTVGGETRIEVSATLSEGMSGGPIFNKRGILAGVTEVRVTRTFASERTPPPDQSSFYGVSAQEVRQFLQQATRFYKPSDYFRHF